MWQPWFYHSPVANITVMSMYRQSGGENAGFRTEVSNTGSVLKERLWHCLEDILRHNKLCTDLMVGFPSDGARIRCWLLLYHFLWGFFLLFWKEVKTLKMWDASWVWKFSGMSEILENCHLWLIQEISWFFLPIQKVYIACLALWEMWLASHAVRMQ